MSNFIKLPDGHVINADFVLQTIVDYSTKKHRVEVVGSTDSWIHGIGCESEDCCLGDETDN